MKVTHVFAHGYCERSNTVVDQLAILFDLNGRTYHAEADRTGKLLYVVAAGSVVPMSASWTEAINARFGNVMRKSAEEFNSQPKPEPEPLVEGRNAWGDRFWEPASIARKHKHG